ncbi:MAG TPA: methyl-accepting chemotaxis protein [Pyrinomonadaceae bacterium]|nr:methyl-accepting chemotaxis protein [Pyrinomonadaceae bacterium]
METPFWNLIIKFSSAAAALSLLTAAALVAASNAGLTQNHTAGVTTLIFAVALGIFSLAAVNLSHSRLRRELAISDAAAHRLAQGELLTGGENPGAVASLRDISTYLAERAAHAMKIETGELSANVQIRSTSDVLGMALQDMTERLRELIGTEETRGTLQRSIVKLLEEVSEVSAGDLTVQAEVGPELTGEIADAFNSMTRNLRSLIKQVKDVTVQVGSSANAISDTTEQLAHGSVVQASQIARTTAAISEMAIEIQEVSKNASLSAQVAAESLNSARSGTKAAGDNINAMNSVRKQVQETAKRIKKLGERSQEIGQIVTLIDDLSDRTGLLALNASLQASAAGESGNGFAVVAEEVERLAERSNRLTQQISSLTQTINIETKEVVASMEETIHEVVVGSTLADKAGQSLIEIENVSSRLAEILRSISDSAKVQAKSSEDISTAMANISEVTELVQNGSRRAAESVRSLVQLSGDLRKSVAPFKLPAEMNGHDASRSNRFVN